MPKRTAKPKLGRPPIGAEPMQKKLVTLDRGSIVRGTKLGDGNLSAGIRKALKPRAEES